MRPGLDVDDAAGRIGRNHLDGSTTGLQPANVPIANGLTQLVSLDSWTPGTSLVFDLPPLSPGFMLLRRAC